MQRTGQKHTNNIPISDIKKIMKAIYQFPTLSTVDTLTKLMKMPRWKVEYVFNNRETLTSLLRPDDLKEVRYED